MVATGNPAAAGLFASAALGPPVPYVVKNTFVAIADGEVAEPVLRPVRSHGALPLCMDMFDLPQAAKDCATGSSSGSLGDEEGATFVTFDETAAHRPLPRRTRPPKAMRELCKQAMAQLLPGDAGASTIGSPLGEEQLLHRNHRYLFNLRRGPSDAEPQHGARPRRAPARVR